MSQYLQLAKKLKALADQGLGGEKYNAIKALDRVMKRYDITKEMLEQDTLYPCDFRFKPDEMGLFIQVVHSVMGAHVDIHGYKKRKTVGLVKCTKLQEAEVRARFSFYQRVYVEERKLFFHAFCMKNGLFATDVDASDFEMTPEQRLMAERVYAIAKSIERAEYFKPIGVTVKK